MSVPSPHKTCLSCRGSGLGKSKNLDSVGSICPDCKGTGEWPAKQKHS